MNIKENSKKGEIAFLNHKKAKPGKGNREQRRALSRALRSKVYETAKKAKEIQNGK